MALQSRGIAAADRHFVVSRQWQNKLRQEFGVPAEIIGNGVDTELFHADKPAIVIAQLQARLQLGSGPILLSIGGVEERKKQFASIAGISRSPTRISCGAAHRCRRRLAPRSFRNSNGLSMKVDRRCWCRKTPLSLPGPLPQPLMPALYRRADLLVFPSIKEGFGLAVLEAMASGTPVVTSNIPPFTEYLKTEDAAWCDPFDVMSITQAMRQALGPYVPQKLRRNGLLCGGKT